MRRLFFAALAALMIATATPAAAITYGQPDGNAHPQVGLVTFFNADGKFIWRCSGTLLSATVLLTAGHCTAPDGPDTPTTARVWFASSIAVGGVPGDASAPTCALGWVGYPCDGGDSTGRPHPHPLFGQNFPNTRDVGVVRLDAPQSSAPYATLPTLGFLDSFATKRGRQPITLTAVGYGLREVKPFFNAGGSVRERYAASQQIKDLRSALTGGYNLATTNSPGNGTGDGYTAPGGTCFGDSGGPVYYGNSNVIVGITSFGLNNNCKGGDYAFRTDIAETRAFLALFGITAP